MAQGIAVQSGGLQDLIDPAAAGRGPVPESGLATFDLLALTGAGDVEQPVTNGNKKIFSDVMAPATGIDVSGDDFAGAIDTLVATGLLLKDGVTAKPFVPPVSRDWVLSVSVPRAMTEQLEPGADALSNVPIQTGEIPVFLADISTLSSAITGTITGTLEIGFSDAELMPVAGELMTALGAVLEPLEEFPTTTGTLPLGSELAVGLSPLPSLSPFLTLISDGATADIVAVELQPPSVLADGTDTAPLPAIGTPHDSLLMSATIEGASTAIDSDVEATSGEAYQSYGDGEVASASSQDVIDDVDSAEHVRIAKENAKAGIEVAEASAAAGIGVEALVAAGLATATMTATSQSVSNAKSDVVSSDDDVGGEGRSVLKWSAASAGIKTFEKAANDGNNEAADVTATHSKTQVSRQVELAGTSADVDDSDGTGLLRDGMRLSQNASGPGSDDLINVRAQDETAKTTISDRGPKLVTDGLPDVNQPSSPVMQDLATRSQERSADGRKHGSRPIAGSSSERSSTDGSATGSSNDRAFVAAESANEQGHERRQHERREERQIAAISLAQQKSRSADEESLRAEVESALEQLDGSLSNSEGLVATRSTLLADGNQSSVVSSATGKSSSDDSKTENTDISKFSSVSSGSSSFFGLQQPTGGEQVFASRRPSVQDAIVVEMRNRAIERQILTALKNGKNEITMTLFPAHLGEVVIKLSMDGQKVRLGFKTATRDAKDTLIESEATLKDTLANSGLILSSLDISADTDARPHQHDAGAPLKQTIPADDNSAVFSINRLA